MSTDHVTLPDGYKPSKDEAYMNKSQLEYFRQKLEKWKKDLLDGCTITRQHLQSEEHAEPDPADRATTEQNRTLELRTHDRERKLIAKIDAALSRISEGTYGYCEHSGDPIGIKRLEARPTAVLCILEQERHEKKEKTVRDERVDV